ncbi:lysozyme, partial [Yangia sp. PrR007]|nr:lysozyme [Salipiger sp. PrR007]
RENVAGLVKVETKQKELTEQLGEIEGLQESIANQRPFDAAAESAREAADEVERLANAETNLKSGIDAAKKLIREKEDFRPDAYPDWSYKNGKRYNSGWRAGYGSDTYTTPDGRPHRVAEGMTITRAQAELDLDRRIRGYFDTITEQIGETAFAALSDDQKGSLASLLHNYGTGEFRAGGDLGGVVSALRGGTSQEVADAIGGLARHNNGINEKRRLEEAAAFGSTSSAEAALARADALQKVIAAGSKQLDQLQLEAELAGQSVEAQARLTFQYEAVRRAKEAGINPETTLTEDGRKLVDVINEQAEAYGKLMAARDEADKQRETSGDEDQDRTQRIDEYRQEMSRLFDNLKPGGNGWTGFIDDFQTYLLDKLWELALDPVWKQLSLLMDQAFGAIGPGGTLAFSGAGATSGYSASSGAMVSGGLYSTGGPLPRRAGGGGFRSVPRAVGMLQGSGSKKQDNLLFWGSRGEFMQPAAAVDYYGLEFMEALRRREVPKFAEGGAMPGTSTGGAGGVTLRQGDVVVNNFAGVEVEQRRDAAGNLSLDLRRAVSDMISSGGADAALQNRFNLKKPPRGR